MQKNRFSVISSGAFALALAIVVTAQTATATLKGAVTDAGSNALSGAIVTLTNTANGLKKTFTTDAGGQFTFTFIEPGFYAVEAQAAGFKGYRQPRLQLEVGQAAELNITLSPGEVQETVNIVATEPTGLETATSTLGGVVGRTRVDALPLNGRNVFQLAHLEIGVTTAPGSRGANPDLTASGEVSINGGRTLNTEALVDGIPLSNKGDNRISLRPSPDAVQEFQIVSNSFPAEYGRTGGGGFNVVTAALAGLTETPFIASLNNGISPMPGTTLGNPFPSGIVPANDAYPGPLTGFGQQSVQVRLRAIRQPKLGQWNLNVQRELLGGITFEAACSAAQPTSTSFRPKRLPLPAASSMARRSEV